MNQENRPLGFVAFWKLTDTWYRESDEQKRIFQEQVEAIFAEAREKGVKMYGEFDCSWSSEWRYFTFWEVPDLETLEETMTKLQAIGDINMYNIQHHYVGRKVK